MRCLARLLPQWRQLPSHAQTRTCTHTYTRAFTSSTSPSPLNTSSAANPASIRPGAPSQDEYKTLRLSQLARLTASSYPHAIPNTTARIVSQQDFVAEFDSRCSENQAWLTNEAIAIIGRVVLRRDAGRNLVFLVLERNGARLQAVLNRKHWPESSDNQAFDDISAAISLGDVVFAQGCPGRTKSGELSLRLTSLHVLAPCLHRFPKKNTFIADENIRFRQRYLDMLVNETTVPTFLARSKIIRGIRSFLDSRGFVEIETPILSSIAGGANARPFKTRMEAMDLDLEMRIAPELFLKQLVIGGIERVYEIGKQFRNEELAKSATGAAQVPWIHSNGETHTIDFEPPFKRIDIIPTLEKTLGIKLPDPNDPASIDPLLKICASNQIHVSKPHTLPRIIDKLVSELIEPQCLQPTFLIGHPISMSPLAKEGSVKGITDRFELFVGTRELANAYLELNDPFEQRQRFAMQMLDRDQGDAEAQPMDEAFCVALEHGLPPTVGWGLGVDRLCMLLTQSTRIRDVIAFPVLKPDE
eukprot:jgi/Hompol1/1362/HPOL_002695-RA